MNSYNKPIITITDNGYPPDNKILDIKCYHIHYDDDYKFFTQEMCECGIYYVLYRKQAHKRSIKHKEWLIKKYNEKIINMSNNHSTSSDSIDIKNNNL